MPDTPPEFPDIPADDAGLLAQCKVETFRAGGPGGQHQNTSDTGVRLTHLPTGLRVVARKERSQARNRAEALRTLRRRLEALAHRPAKRVSTRVPPREKKKRLEDKRRRADTKAKRRPPDADRE